MSDTPSFWSLFAAQESPPAQAPSAADLFCDTDPAGFPQAQQQAPSAVYFNEDLVFWALRNLPAREAVHNFLICGTPGSGKTKAIELFLQSIAPRFRSDWKRPEQLILFDAKGEVVSLLAGLGLHPDDPNVYILNPDDKRGAVWDVGEAVRTPALARHFATLLIPEEPGTNAPFFPNSARLLVYAVILALNQVAGTHWTLRDLLCALDSRDRIKAITGRHPPSERVVASFLKDEKHFDAILSSISSKVGAFDQVAALWHSSTSKKKFSISKFLERPGVLVLSNDPVLRDSFWPINAILLKALTHEILRGPETRDPRHWFVLDEFPAMNNVDCIKELLTRGRSKGASVMLGIQGIEQLAEIYRPEGMESIMGQCAYKTFLRAGGPTTAEWAQRYFGTIRQEEPSYSESWSQQGHSESVGYSIQERSVFTSSFFMNLPFPRPDGLYVAISDVPYLGSTLIGRRPFEQMLGWCRPSSDVPNTIPRPNIVEQTLWPWTTEEEAAFCGFAEKPKDDAQATAPPKALPPPPPPPDSGPLSRQDLFGR